MNYDLRKYSDTFVTTIQKAPRGCTFRHTGFRSFGGRHIPTETVHIDKDTIAVRNSAASQHVLAGKQKGQDVIFGLFDLVEVFPR